MSNSNNTESQNNSLGEQFRQARERLNLSLEDVSKQINLRPSILQHLENNEFVHKSIPVAFMKGYIRNYAKFLRLPESCYQETVSSLSENTHNNLSKNTYSSRKVDQHFSHNHRWISYITVLVLFIVAGMTALWWWENYQQSNQEREDLVQNYSQQHAETQPAVTKTVENEPMTPMVAAVEQTKTDSPSSSNLGNVEEQNPVAVPQLIETKEKSVTVSNLNEVNILPAAETKETESTPTLQSEMNKLTDNGANPSTQVAPTAMPSGDLVIEITDSTCWISVKDNNRKVLAQKEYKQGEILNFNGGAPYSLIIGAPSNVKITYKGETYPLKVDGRVAKFKLE